MASYNKFNQFLEDAMHKVHDLSADQLVVVLTNTAPVAGNSVLADLTPISMANMSSGNLTVSDSSQTSGVYKCTVSDLTFTASGVVPTFRYVVIYNDTPTSPADPLIAWYDNGVTVDLTAAETFDVDFDDSNGLFQVA